MDKKRFKLASRWEELGASCWNICLKEIDFRELMVITKGWNPTRQFRPLEVRANRIRENKATIQDIEEQLTQTGHQHISGQESPFFTIPGCFQEKTRIQGQKKDHLWPDVERVGPNDPEAVGFGKRSAPEPEVIVNNCRIRSHINRNITPTKIDHNVVAPEGNLNSDSLWLQISQFTEKTQKQFAELQASHGRMKTLTNSMDKIVKTLQEGHAQLSKASEETNKGLN
ncbi:hypothetical protein O181_115714 [Austropuccinia psidii MF-1]|uniref:Uncharacterized protein n=1 Tax=Austropuccinia psidii MF-1 TaxID=1389203 RepID=A0A9Q3K7K5_9BASI|nr:hypothetical protein [Austropuccinia psidii MF-1]